MNNISINKRTQKIHNLIKQGYKRKDIIKKLNISISQYRVSYEKIKLLQSKNIIKTPTEQLRFDIADGNVVVFSDAHVLPGCDDSIAAKALIKLCNKLKPKYIICLGDTFDFASISKHDPLGWNKIYTVNEELTAGVDLLNRIRSSSPSSKCLMTLSNHDQRYDKKLALIASQYKDVFGMSLMDHIDGWDFGISIMTNKCNNNHKIMFKHQFNSSVHTAYQNTLKSGISIITGHTHRLVTRPWVDYTGIRYGVEVGTLAQIDNPLFNYTEHNPCDWISGFVVLTFKDGQLLQPENCSVINDEAYFRGIKI